MNEAKIRTRHLAYFVRLVEQAEPELYHSNQAFWFNRLDDELNNLRVALEWALDRDIESGLRIVTLPWRFWQRLDYLQEVIDWIGQLLERYPTSDSLRVQALAMYANYIFLRGNMTEARKAAEQGLQLARDLSDRRNEALCLLFLGKIIAAPGGHEEGISLFEQSLAIYRTLGDEIGQATASYGLAIHTNDDLEQSKSFLLESLKLHRVLGNLYDIAFCLTHLARQTIFAGDLSSPFAMLSEAKTIFHQLGAQPDEGDVLNFFGVLAYWQGNYEQALTHFEQAIALYEKVGVAYWATWPRVGMAYTFLRKRDYRQASNLFEISLHQFQRDDSVIGVVYTIEGLASLHLKRRQPEHAARLIGWTDFMRETLGNPRPPIERADVDKTITACVAQMGEFAFSDQYNVGQKLSLEEATAYALEEC